MSGICGIVDFDDRVRPEVLDDMIGAANHRALGGSALHVDGGVGLGFLSGDRAAGTRLDQPHGDDGVVVVADARIDNRDELVPAFLRMGRLDSADVGIGELLVACYQEWGEDMATRLVGDYALAIWDGRRSRLFAARDPMAMRSLYYRCAGSRLLFATELKQILAVPGQQITIDETSVAEHLTGLFSQDHTMYEGINALAPAHTLCFDGRQLRLRRFWKAEPSEDAAGSSYDEYAEQLLARFERAVADRLRNVASAGILLSGGVDSGSVASMAGRLAAAQGGPELRSYSWAFPTLSECDERPVSRLITSHYGILARDVDAEANHPLARYPQHGPDRDEPFIGVYQPAIEAALAAAAEDGVEVMLGGDRGDLMVGGFAVSFPHLIAAGDPGLVGREVSRLASLTDRSRFAIMLDYVVKPTVERLRALGPMDTLRRIRRRQQPGGTDRASQTAPWLPQDVVTRRRAEMPVDPTPDHLHPWTAQRRQHVLAPLHMTGVRWSERTYARFGLRFADPFSDVRLAEYVLAIPQLALNLPGAPDKQLMRTAMRGIVPAEAVRAARKVSPHPLWHRALRDRAATTVASLLNDMEAAARGYVVESALQHHYRQIRDGAEDHPLFWWALSLEMWLRAYWT